MTQHIRSKAAVFAWCLYDWAAASFSIIVTTFIFATYFTTSVAADHVVGTYQWANAVALAGVIIAFASPLLGAVADYGGNHKSWLWFFTLVCVGSTALLWFAYPGTQSIPLVLTCLVVGTIGFELSLVFYNAFLPRLGHKKYIGRISGWGWAAGYLGGIVALTIALFIFVRGGWLNRDTAEQVRICGPFAALWYFIFALPFFIFTPSMGKRAKGFSTAMKMGCRELWRTIKTLPQDKNIFLYLIAHMIYTDGLNTLFAFGGIYAAGTYGLSFDQVLMFGITMNVAAGMGALLLAWVDDLLGSKPTVLMSLAGIAVAGTIILFLHDKYVFWTVALFACLFVGPIQSASRSLMVHLIEGRHNTAEMFGLYSLSGRVTSFVGPWLLGLATITFQSQRAGMAIIIIFFVVGGFAMLPVTVTRHDSA